MIDFRSGERMGFTCSETSWTPERVCCIVAGFRLKATEFRLGGLSKDVRHIATPVAVRLWSGMTGSLRTRRFLTRSANLLCPAASRKAGRPGFLDCTGNPAMTTASFRSPSSRHLLERFENLHSRMALLRDICAIAAAESCSRARIESISPGGWEGLSLLCEEIVSELERSINEFSELAKTQPT